MIYNDLVLFTLVAQHLSFSAAAEQLDIPLSRVSRRIAELEQHFGVKLLERSTRRVRLTEEGQRLLDRCQAPVEALNDITDFAEDTKSQVIRMTAPVVAARTTVGPKLLDYAAQHPDVLLHLTTTNTVLDFYRDRIDFAFRVGPLEDSSLISRKLWSISYCFCASHAVLDRWAVNGPVSLEQLVRLPAVVSRQSWLFQSGKVVKSENVVHEIDDLDVIKAAVLKGLGIAMLPRDMLEEGMQEITLADASLQNRDMFAIYPGKRLLPSRVRNLIDFMAG